MSTTTDIVLLLKNSFLIKTYRDEYHLEMTNQAYDVQILCTDRFLCLMPVGYSYTCKLVQVNVTKFSISNISNFSCSMRILVLTKPLLTIFGVSVL